MSSRPKRTSKAPSASQKGKKKVRTATGPDSLSEEALPNTDEYLYRSGFCKNKFLQDFRGRKVLGGRWIDFAWFNSNGFDYKEMFDYQGWSKFVTLKLVFFPILVKLVYSNLEVIRAENVTSYVNARPLDLSVTFLNEVISAPNEGKRFIDGYSWAGMSEVDPIEILRVVMDDQTLDRVFKPTANALNIHRRILHHMVCNIILPRTGKFEYMTYLELFIMYCLITRKRMNLGHLIVNHMKAAQEKKQQRLPYGMLFTHIFHACDVSIIGEAREKPKIFQEYNEKTLRLMGYMKNDEGLWVKKGAGAPQREEERGSESEEEPAADADIPMREPSPMPVPPPPFSYPTWEGDDSQFASFAASLEEIKEGQRRLGLQMENLSLSVKDQFELQNRRYDTLSADVRDLKLQVNKGILTASDVIQTAVDEFASTSNVLKNSMASTSRDVVAATERHMEIDRNLRPMAVQWTYWFSTTWTNWLKKWNVDYDPPPFDS